MYQWSPGRPGRDTPGPRALPGAGNADAVRCQDCFFVNGTEEVINRADGATLWKLKGAKMSSVMVNAEGSYMVAQNDKDLTIGKLTP